MTRKSETEGKADRALELLQKGVSTAAIVERLGLSNVNHAHRLISEARKRRIPCESNFKTQSSK
jgi:hypothetical protein